VNGDNRVIYCTVLKPFAVLCNTCIENLNKSVKKATKNKLFFKKEDRLLDCIFVIIKAFEQSNWMKYPVSKYNHWVDKTRLG